MRLLAILLVLVAIAGSAFGARRDPLNPKETDQLRETAQEPDKRLLLYATFARARLATIEGMRSDPRFAGDRGRQIHDLLEDFTEIVDELDNNVAAYDDRNFDLRKPLKKLVEALSEFQVKLRTMKELRGDAQFRGEFRDYSFPLDSAIDAVNSTLDDTRKTLEDQELERAKKKKDDKQ